MSLQKNMHYILSTILCTMGVLVIGQNASPYVERKLDADSIFLGSQTKLLLSVATPGDYLWQWPLTADQITEKVEIVSQSGIDTVSQKGSDLVMLNKYLLITSFDSGFHAIPPFVFKYQLPGDTVWNTIETEPALIFVAGLEVDLNLPIRDIKDPIRAPLTFMEILPWLLLAILVVTGILLYRRYLKRKKERVVHMPKPIKPKIPPHTIALDAMEQLRQKKLWQSGLIKEYHTELTDILRHYLESRFIIMALEMTTSEIMGEPVVQRIPSQAREKLQIIFERADLVKFAKSIPLPAQHEESFAYAVDFIRATIPLAGETDMHSEQTNSTGAKNVDKKQ